MSLGAIQPEEPEEEAEGDGEEAEDAREKSPKPYKVGTVLVDNVLLGDNTDKVHFFRRKDVGSYLALHVNYDTLLHEEAMALQDEEFTLPIIKDEVGDGDGWVCGRGWRWRWRWPGALRFCKMLSGFD